MIMFTKIIVIVKIIVITIAILMILIFKFWPCEMITGSTLVLMSNGSGGSPWELKDWWSLVISHSVDDWGFDIYRMLIYIPLCHAACMMRISWKRMKMLLSAETASLRISSQYSRQKHALPPTCCRRGSGTWKGWRAFWDGFCRICTCHYHYHYLYYHRHFYPEADFYGSALSNFRQRLLYPKTARKSGWWSYWSQDRPTKWHPCSAQFCKTLEKLIITLRYNLCRLTHAAESQHAFVKLLQFHNSEVR